MTPELDPQETIWQFMRQNWLSNRIFKSYGATNDVVDTVARNTLIDQPWKIIAIREEAIVGHPS